MGGLSAKQICADIVILTNGTIKPIKKQLLNYLREKNVTIRSTSEATKCWVEKTGGIWNKGETKYSHPSVQKYAENRKGKANPFFNTEPDKRIDTYYQRISEEEVKALRKTIALSLKSRYRSGLVHWAKTDPQKVARASAKCRSTWQKKLEAGIIITRYYSVSAMERKLGKFLTEIGETFQTQMSFGYYSYDYVLDLKKIVIEYNGAYWHCDPRKYKPDYWHSKKKKYAYQIWEKDEKKKQVAEKAGYRYLPIWEIDVQRMTDEQIKQHLIDSIKNCIDTTSTG